MTVTNKTLTLQSPAKINLGLKVVGKRDDGYHEIETIFQMINIFDVLTFKSVPSGIVFKTNHKELPTDETNLVVKAANLLCRETGVEKGVEIFLKKNIPVGAGLGGGSGNAAFTLAGLNRLWDLRLPAKDLIKLALNLGSDVPFFLSGPSAVGKGRGEILEPFEYNTCLPLVVVFPEIFISSGSVYKELKVQRENISDRQSTGSFNLGLTSNTKDISILRSKLLDGSIENIGSLLFNDLEAVVCNKYPALEKIKKQLMNSGAVGSLISGSGSSVFGLFLQPLAAREAAGKLSENNWQVFLTETINKPLDFL